jgi:hypothetical protein
MNESYWYCPNCKEEVDGSCVTFQELHEVCGHPVECITPEDNLQSRLDAALAEVELLNTRLERNYAFDKDGNRIQVKPGDVPDGIDCRDETIRGLQQCIKELEEGLTKLQYIGDENSCEEIGHDKDEDDQEMHNSSCIGCGRFQCSPCKSDCWLKALITKSTLKES